MIFPQNEEDSLIWWGVENNTQAFSIKTIYATLNANPEDPIKPLWKKILSKGLIPKIAYFM